MVKTVYFVVKFELPDGATKQAAADYVRDAVQTYRGSLWHGDASHEDPEAHDPDTMFMLDSNTVTVRPYCNPKKRLVARRYLKSSRAIDRRRREG